MDAVLLSPHQLSWGDRRFRCAIGRGGIAITKREGDGATPVGRFPFRQLLFRADHLKRPDTALQTNMIMPNDGWCDDPSHPEYNRQIKRPFASSHELLWRDDGFYDVIIVVGHNDSPPERGAGSAIFIHLAHDNYAPTEGCVAVALADLLTIVSECSARSALQVTPPPT